jgi:hypothetical protein
MTSKQIGESDMAKQGGGKRVKRHEGELGKGEVEEQQKKKLKAFVERTARWTDKYEWQGWRRKRAKLRTCMGGKGRQDGSDATGENAAT